MVTTLKIMMVLAVAFSAVGILYLLQERLIFPAPDIAVPAINEGGFSSVLIKTPDGETLLALHHPAEDGEVTIMVFHGNADAAIYQGQKGVALAEAGFGVLLVEYRGYPGSTGSASEGGLFIDGRAAYDFIAGQTEGPIGLYAHSLGTGVAVKLASEREVFAVVLESPFDSLMAVAQRRMPWLPMGWLLKHKFRSDQVIDKVKAPILMIHGRQDKVIPIQHGKRLEELAPEGVRFLEIKDAGHNNLAQFGSIQEAISFFEGLLE